jgi:hypothetical protein
MLADLPQRLCDLGVYILPVVPEQPPKPNEKESEFKGKNPSYFNKDGIPYPMTYKQYRDNPPTGGWVSRWFHPNHPYGYFFPCGQLDLCCIDFDTKRYEFQDAVDKEYEAFLIKLDGHIIWTDKTPHGGYHIWVKLTNKPEFKLFATDNIDKTHRGEILAKDNGAVISPTVGYRLLVDNLDQFNDIPALDNLETYGMYPSSEETVTSKAKVATNDQTFIEMSDLCSGQNYNPDAKLSISKLVDSFTQNLLANSVTDIPDRSSVFTRAISEIVGWSNFLKGKEVSHNDDVEDLINLLISNLGIEDKADRCIKSLKDIDQLKPIPLSSV